MSSTATIQANIAQAKVNEARIAELEAMLAAQSAQLKAAKAAQNMQIRFKVSEKGAVSVYGLNARFPITLYRDQWTRLLAQVPALEQFITDNAAKLTSKQPKV